MAEFDWSRFSIRINIKNASTEKLYWAWATRQGMEYWFLRMSEYRSANGKERADNALVEKGDTYTWRWHGWGDEATETGEILDCNGWDRFKFSFGNAGNCSVKIYPEQDEMIVELTQDTIPTDEKGKQNWHIGCKTGWTFYLTNMKSLFEGGPDLRNKNAKLQSVISA